MRTYQEPLLFKDFCGVLEEALIIARIKLREDKLKLTSAVF